MAIRTWAERAFYANFFRGLVVAVSAAQWAVLAWCAQLVAATPWPWWAHLGGVALVYAGNRAIVATRTRRRGWAMRVYTATAFTSLFCAAFLLASALVFVAAHAVLGVIAAQAVTAAGAVPLAPAIDGAFRWIASLGMGTIALTIGYGYVFGQRELTVNRIALGGGGAADRQRLLRITQISDIHIGVSLEPGELRAMVERVNGTDPDLICITGDIADGPGAELDRFFPILAGLRARHGVCAILGNHDHYAGAERVVAALRRWTDFHVLRDTAVTIAAGGAAVHVIGLDDRGRDWARGVRSDATLAVLLDAAPADATTIVLAHRPDIFPQAAAAGVSLTLSGHTHGGQLALPWANGRRYNLASFITRFDRGLFRDGGSVLYVNCGLGVTAQRIRLFTPREITVIELPLAA